MGKKNRKKKKNKLHKAIQTEKAFKNQICTQCNLCVLEHTPSFCFEEMCAGQPAGRRIFVEHCFPKLLKVKDNLDISTDTLNQITPERFSLVFCNPEACMYSETFNKSGSVLCDNIMGCYSMFRNQLQGRDEVTRRLEIYGVGGTSTYSKYTKSKKKKKVAVVKKAKPYPTFIVSTNLKEEVDRIINGNKNSKQDTNQGSTR